MLEDVFLQQYADVRVWKVTNVLRDRCIKKLNARILSLLSLVDESIVLCQVEEANIKESSIQCREILRSLRPQQEDYKETVMKDDVAIDPDVLPEERQEMELLNRMLEKAVQVRGGTKPHKDPPNSTRPKNEPVDTTLGRQRAMPTDCVKGTKNAIRSASKPIAIGKNESVMFPPVRPSSSGRGKTGHLISRSVKIRKQLVTSSKRLPLQSSGKVPKQTCPPGRESHDEGPVLVPVPGHYRESEVSQRSLFGEDSSQPAHERDPVSVLSRVEGLSSTESPVSVPLNSMLSKWSSLRNRGSRLWEKVLAYQSKHVVEQNHFMERVKATFPKEYPCHRSPADTGAQVDRMTELCRDLTQRCQISELTGTKPGTCKKNNYESLLMLDGLEQMVTDLRRHAGQLMKESEAWDRRGRPEGCDGNCTVRRRARLGDPGRVAVLPPTLVYTTQAELQEVERLRLRVEVLQQEVQLQQALSDIVVTLSSPGPPNPSVLRDIYSLLAEGGVQFPSLVLDMDPD
ncbi:hypothetical protein DPEC_G00309090 [Dallia pectoralis]|uniref:Uncharacterized protein n=1 Tax=Dallia pectoralis TaxID=75939 RepID=A0ACC2FF05_DALPE|nr:hypothetical protein DPEC_G00309090 [Dallia pectoralis]